MKNSEFSRWLKTIFITFFIFSFFSIYLFLRRGYYNLYIINKVFGSSAVVVAGITLLVGPLAKKYPYFSRFMTIRRHLGLSAFGFALAHTIASLIQQNRFPFPSWYADEFISTIFGILTVFVWAYMAYISRNTKVKELRVEVWKKRLSIAGQLGFIAIFLHLTMMKYQGWINWWNGKVKSSPELANPSYPPASIFVFLFMSSVIIYRIFHFVRNRF